DKGLVALDLNEQSVALLRTDLIDRIFFRVISPSGETLAGDSGLKGPANVAGVTFFDATFQGKPVRGVAYPVAMPSGVSVVLVAETTIKRNQARRDMIAARLVQDFSVVLFAILVVWLSVRSVLRPLEQLAAQVQARSPLDLKSLRQENSPREVLPLIDALNRLFGRIGSTLDGQRRFIENAAHQLRTPLAGLQGQVELAVREANSLGQPGGQGGERLGRSVQATGRVTRLANLLVTLSRSDRPTHDTAGGRQLQLAELVTDVVAVQIDRAIDREQDLGAETQPVMVRAIEWELREVLSNLIDNAIRYTPRTGRITVRCGPHGAGAFIEVEDSGPGIPGTDRDRVFERFYR
ncbi:MAG: sensor histidine kinase N-terminal domain-containing protein, partial [Quisquiliibacterium sp.]